MIGSVRLYSCWCTSRILDLARPDFIMPSMLSRNLVMWSHLQPSAAWMSAPAACAHLGLYTWPRVHVGRLFLK